MFSPPSLLLRCILSYIVLLSPCLPLDQFQLISFGFWNWFAFAFAFAFSAPIFLAVLLHREEDFISIWSHTFFCHGQRSKTERNQGREPVVHIFLSTIFTSLSDITFTYSPLWSRVGISISDFITHITSS